jgi:DNA-binding transcriptional MerR regulator
MKAENPIDQSTPDRLGPVRLLSTKGVAQLLSIPEGTLRYWRKVGLGPTWVKLEGTIRYSQQDILEYIRRNRRTPSVRAYMEEKDAL